MSGFRKLLAGRTLEMNTLREVSSRCQIKGKIVFHILGPRTALRSVHIQFKLTRLGLGWLMRESSVSKRGKKPDN